MAIISDTGYFEGNVPAITVGLRGIMYAQVDVEVSPVDLHSGMYGGSVENPANALARIITALKGPDGRIRIPGFYDDVVALTAAEREAMAALPFDEAAYPRPRSRCPPLVGEAGWTTLERKTARPTLDVNGMWSGFQGEGAKTIIPAHAHAKVSTRLVANQDPATVYAALRDYVAEVAPPGVTVSTTYIHGGEPSLTPTDHPATQAAARAIEAVHGVAPGLHPRGWLDPGHRRLRPLPGAPGGAHRLHAADLQRPRAQRDLPARELRAGHARHRAALGRARDAAR